MKISNESKLENCQKSAHQRIEIPEKSYYNQKKLKLLGFNSYIVIEFSTTFKHETFCSKALKN